MLSYYSCYACIYFSYLILIIFSFVSISVLIKNNYRSVSFIAYIFLFSCKLLDTLVILPQGICDHRRNKLPNFSLYVSDIIIYSSS